MSEEFEAAVTCSCGSADVEVTATEEREMAGFWQDGAAHTRTVIYYACCTCGVEAAHHRG